MEAKYTVGLPPALERPEIVVVGSATRDLTDDDPRGWRLGGGVSYGALTTARIGLRTTAIVGVDSMAADAWELDLLRRAGADVRLVPLEHGPVFVNVERPEGRLQLSEDRSDAIPTSALPEASRGAAGWLLVPVAGELPAEWADVPGPDALVGVGWQGLLRVLVPGEPVQRRQPGPDPIVARADLVGVSRDDVSHAVPLAELLDLLHDGASLLITQGDRGGIIANRRDDGLALRRYPAVPNRHPVDPTGAGDVFLAALTAVRVEPRLVGGRLDAGFDLLLAAAAASLVIEGPGLLGVPDRAAIRGRIAEFRQAAPA